MPVRGSNINEPFFQLMREYEQNPMRFQESEIKTRSILAPRIKRAICTPNLMSMLVGQIYHYVLSVREQGSNAL